MAPKRVKSDANISGAWTVLNLDVWHLIIEQLNDRKDLCNACLVSRAWFTMAMPHLYRVVPFIAQNHDVFDWERKKNIMKFAQDLSSRLMDDKNERLRAAVHELDFGRFDDRNLRYMEKRLVSLVASLPNLRRVRIKSQLSPKVLRALDKHHRQIPLYLLGEDGTRSSTEKNFQNVVGLAVQVNPSNETNGPNRRILSTQKLFFACPNLKSFSLHIVGGYGGCVRPMARFERVYSFQFSGDETFPPLEELSISGYWMDDGEEQHWQNKLQWSKLRSLVLGPRLSADFLKVAEGYATSLKNLDVQIYTDGDYEGGGKCQPLEDFLRTFTSLESLTVKGYHIPLGPIKNHPGLKHLCLHSFEKDGDDGHGGRGGQRPTLSVEQLRDLDESFPYLETLEIDLYRDGKWPVDIFKALATGFRRLRSLTLHLEVGIDDTRNVNLNVRTRNQQKQHYLHIMPILNKDSAKKAGKLLFGLRPPSSIMEVLILKTGEPLRRFPQWEPGAYRFERRNTDTIEVHRPRTSGGVPRVVVHKRHFSAYY
ncbi:hypothetical protein F4777DRAFT_559245 [Nemania sp. FL0916]|nr:hypothetical protein F4777DRAFT_559245 [Nemania sp. FL0916]